MQKTCGVGNDTNHNLDSTLNPASLNTITNLSNTVMFLLLQISAHDTAVTHKNPNHQTLAKSD